VQGPSPHGSIDAFTEPVPSRLRFVVYHQPSRGSLSWQSETARVFVRRGDDPPRLFACGNRPASSWRRGLGWDVQYTFTLDAASSCDSSPQLSPLASVTVTGQR
jgi:hypothetical protein